MRFEHILEQMKNRMPERRYIHTRGVAETAIELADKYGADTKKQKLPGFYMTV